MQIISAGPVETEKFSLIFIVEKVKPRQEFYDADAYKLSDSD